MNTTTQASRFIPITNPDLRFMGRIDRTPADHQTWAFPYTQVSFRCTGTSIGVRLVNHWGYGDAYLGAIIDGMQVKARVPIDGAHDGISMENGYPSRVEPTGQQDDGPRHPVDVAIAADLPNIEHEVTIFKRQDEGNNRFDVYGILLDEGAKLMPTATPLPERRIEVYGDSVTCGERCEAACYVGQADPEVDLSPYSNAWYSYAAITARNLGAQAHLVSQGGTTLLDGIGWFHAPDYIGMESIWDKSVYNTQLGGTSPWDFAQYTPHVVVVALGQNDAHPRDFMADDYDGEEATHWRARYVDFVHALRGKISACADRARHHRAHPRPVLGSRDRRGVPYGQRRRRRPRTALPVLAQRGGHTRPSARGGTAGNGRRADRVSGVLRPRSVEVTSRRPS